MEIKEDQDVGPFGPLFVFRPLKTLRFSKFWVSWKQFVKNQFVIFLATKKQLMKFGLPFQGFEEASCQHIIDMPSSLRLL